MGAFLDKPDTATFNDSGSGNGLRYGVASMKGWRMEMEDAHHAQLSLGEGVMSDWSFFAVFDGHAGDRVSEYCAENLLKRIQLTPEWKSDDVSGAIRSGFLELDRDMYDIFILDKSGSTAVCSFISPSSLYIANCGDSRAVLSRGGAPVLATRDHKPDLTEERKRIVEAGGSVMIQRVNGSLAVSRALGDFAYKCAAGRGPCQQLVSPEPEIFVEERRPAEDEFLVLACDGVWDVMSNEELCSFIHSRLKLTEDIVSITNQVIRTCLYKGSRDNMSIVLVVFPAAPKPCPAAQRAERELDDSLRQRLTEIAERWVVDGPPKFNAVLEEIASEELDGLPPGGGLACKREMLAQAFQEKYPESNTGCYDDLK